MPEQPQSEFDALIAPALGRLFATAYRLAGNVSDAEDLVQDTCVLACAGITALRTARQPEHWLLRVLYNRFVDGARRRERAPVVVSNGAVDGASASLATAASADLADQTADERAFFAACARLSESQRAILALRAEGYGLAEIAAITGIGREVLRARLHRARSSLARYLDDESTADGRRSRLGSRS